MHKKFHSKLSGQSVAEKVNQKCAGTKRVYRPNWYLGSLSSGTTNQPICDINLQTWQLVFSSAALSMLAAVLAVERDRDKGCNFDFFDPPERAPLCGFTTRTSRGHYIVRTHRAAKALQIAGVGSLASREMGKQE